MPRSSATQRKATFAARPGRPYRCRNGSSALPSEAESRRSENSKAMRIRRETVEHPFGTIKARMGATHFLMQRLKNVRIEMALAVLAYNLTRVMNIIGIKPLITAIRLFLRLKCRTGAQMITWGRPHNFKEPVLRSRPRSSASHSRQLSRFGLKKSFETTKTQSGRTQNSWGGPKDRPLVLQTSSPIRSRRAARSCRTKLQSGYRAAASRTNPCLGASRSNWLLCPSALWGQSRCRSTRLC
jgi:hypothetical protein